ncbi:MAG: CpsD/CapB family tyrosine-protein kinase [Bacillota bacterium]
MLGRKPRDKAQIPVALTEPRSPMAESFRTLRTNINYAAVDREIKIILVTSPHMGEGKSTASANLGVVLAQTGQETLLVDCDLRKPMLHKIFALANQKGLTNLLTETLLLEELVQPTQQDKLQVLTSGPIPPNPAEMLASRRMANLLDELRSSYERIIIDTTPIEAVTDAIVLSSQVDGVLLVVDSGRTPIQIARDARDKLARANAHILGIVLNRIKRDSNGYYHYYYYHYSER